MFDHVFQNKMHVRCENVNIHFNFKKKKENVNIHAC